MDLKSKIFLIYGPTASGKSKFAIKLAKKIKGEIINADSMQVYKELKILSARPSKKEYKKIKHHLYGFQTAKKIFSTGNWLKLAKKKISEVKKRKKIPILVGGTGLYFKVLIEGLVSIPSIPMKFREKIRLLHKNLGPKNFYLKLLKLDPLAGKNLKPSDTQRIIRAFEINYYTKKSMFDWFKTTNSTYEDKDFYKIYIDYPREELINQINLRAHKMFNQEVILEVKRFIRHKVPPSKTASKAIGLSEIKDYLSKNMEISEVIEKISIKTRQYAKRQSTWGRGNMSDWNKIKPSDLNKFLKKI